MTVKIKDKKVYDCYKDSLPTEKGGALLDRWSAYITVREFIGNVPLSSDPVVVKLIVKAILDGELVELAEPKFRIRILRMNSNGGHQYVTSNVNSTKLFACGEVNPHVLRGTAIQEFTRSNFSNDEWEYFKGNPDVFKFEEVDK